MTVSDILDSYSITDKEEIISVYYEFDKEDFVIKFCWMNPRYDGERYSKWIVLCNDRMWLKTIWGNELYQSKLIFKV